MSGGGTDPGCMTQPGHPPPGLQGCSSPRWPWGPGLGAALQTGVRGSILQRPIPTTAPAASWGSVLAPPSPRGAGPGRAAAPCGRDHMSPRCRCDAAAKAEHHFPPLLLLQTGGAEGEGTLCARPWGAAGQGGLALAPTMAGVALPPCPRTHCSRDGGALSCPMGGSLGAPPLPHSPPTPAPLPPHPAASHGGLGGHLLSAGVGPRGARLPGGEGRGGQAKSHGARRVTLKVWLSSLLSSSRPPAPQGTVPFPYAGRARLAGSRARAEQRMHPAAAALGLGGHSEAPLLRGERKGQLGAPGGFPKPGAP